MTITPEFKRPHLKLMTLQKFRASAQTSVFDGQTLVFGGPKETSDKAILVLVTPTLIDPAGNSQSATLSIVPPLARGAFTLLTTRPTGKG
ncbi:MAG: hypothetical protein L0387_02575 [Acidobacteria bacterium]|nr:hypothetical protein [Acidobacteriota bacterium]